MLKLFFSFFKGKDILGKFEHLLVFLVLFSGMGFLNALGPVRHEITSSGSPYFWGEGSSRDRDEARERALSELSSNISVNIVSRFESVIRETGVDSEEFMESVVTTYTGAAFSNLQPIYNFNDREHVFLYYIHKDKLNEEYEKRKAEIFTMFETATDSHDNLNLSRALQHYYYCLIVMNSIPQSVIPYEPYPNLRLEINGRIEDILENVDFFYTGDLRDSDSIRTVLFDVTYKGKPVDRLDFSYTERGNLYESRVGSGRAACDLTGAAVGYNRLSIFIEYSYAQNRDVSPLVNTLWHGVHRPIFNNQRDISMIEIELPTTLETTDLTTDGFSLILVNDIDCPVEPTIKSETIKFLETISSADKDKINSVYASDPFMKDKLSSLFKHNRPRLIDTTFHIQLNKTWDGWEIRSIPITCVYPSINTQSIEYLVLDFDEQGTLRDVNFNFFDGLFRTYVESEDKIDGKEKLERLTIIKFLEKYRTTFLNRDIKTLEKIFSDEAVIIVGRILEPRGIQSCYELDSDLKGIHYEQIQMTKQEYIDRQRSIFRSQRDIHLGFNTFNIRRRRGDSGIYGISMRQQYRSSGYADEGYLFLLVDFLQDDPMIYVRSWQPHEWSTEQLIDMSDFMIRR